MENIGSITVGGNMTNSGIMRDIRESMSAGNNFVNSGIVAFVEEVSAGNSITNSGYFVNVKNIDAHEFVNQTGAVLGGTQNMNLNGGTFYNNGGTIIVGDTGIDQVLNTLSDPYYKNFGTLAIDGNFESNDGTFVIGVYDNGKVMSKSLINVTGTATIDGGTVYIEVDKNMHFVAADDDRYKDQYKYVFLRTVDSEGNLTKNLTVGGELTTGILDDPLLKAVVRTDYDMITGEKGSQYWFQLERTFLYSGEGKTNNQREMGRYIDKMGILPGGDYRNVLMALDRARHGGIDTFAAASEMGGHFEDPLYKALDQVSGSVYGTATTASFQNTVMTHAALTNVLRRDYNNFAAIVNQEETYLGQTPLAPRFFVNRKYKPSNNLWGMIYGNAGMMHSDGNARSYGAGFSGIMAGMDRTNENRRRLGFFLSMGEGSLSSELQDRVLSKEILVGHYFRKDYDNGYVLIQAGVGNHNYDTKRQISFGHINPNLPDWSHRIDRTARNKHNAFLATAHAETGLLYRGGILNISPFLGAQYTGLAREGFTENGAGSLNLTTDLQTFQSLRALFGVRFDSSPFRLFKGLAAFYGNVAWMYEFELADKRHTEFTARFTDAGLLSGHPSFTVYGNDPGRDWVQTGFGLNYDMNPNVRAFVSYDAYANVRQIMHSTSLGIVWSR
jgi:uncharacterized protein YhjY with autotransporter beta-barrel domain